MASAFDVAKYFLTLSRPDEGDLISNLKLQKLLYYAQGFSLVVLGRNLFDDDIVAWDHGPVVPDVWRAYRHHGAQGIPVPEDFEAERYLSHEERELLDEVWDVYGQFSAWKLRNMTHEEAPWCDTERSDVIPVDLMRAFFRTRVAAGVHAS